MKLSIVTYETTCNDINTLRLIGRHPLKGDQELAVREHNRKTGKVSVRALCAGVGVPEINLEIWPKQVAESVRIWKESCSALEANNAKCDQIGRDLFASLVTE